MRVEVEALVELEKLIHHMLEAQEELVEVAMEGQAVLVQTADHLDQQILVEVAVVDHLQQMQPLHQEMQRMVALAEVV
jgi:hypothetical protein